MPADPTKLYKHLPDCYDRSSSSDQYKLMAALEAGISRTRTEVETFRDEVTLTGASGDGLTRRVQSKGLFRPPGMSDTRLRALAKAIYGSRRGTLAAIKAVAEAATGITVEVNDKQTDSSIPSFEVWITPATGEFWPSYGRAVYPGATVIDRRGLPQESASFGEINNITAGTSRYFRGIVNDRVWGPVDLWTQALVDKVRPAGVKVIWKHS